MDPEQVEFVRQQLKALGHDATPELVEEFIRHMEENGEPIPMPNSNMQEDFQEEELDENEQNDDQYMRRNQINEEEEEELEEIPQPKRNSRISPRKEAKPQVVRKSQRSVDDEIQEWSSRLNNIRQKAKDLDSQISQCREAIIHSHGEKVDIPMYFGSSERKLDPYPAVNKQLVGGFIRPPPVRASRQKVGTVPKGKGRRLLYEERFPDYVPPPERRRDALRWQIRQKLAYSDPKYHQGN